MMSTLPKYEDLLCNTPVNKKVRNYFSEHFSSVLGVILLRNALLLVGAWAVKP